MEFKEKQKIKLLSEMKSEYRNGIYKGIKVGSIGEIIKISKINNQYILKIKWKCNSDLRVILPLDKIQLVE